VKINYGSEDGRTFIFKDECSICHRTLKPMCDTKIVDGIVYCIDCYRKKVYPLRMKKLKENKK
jgi:hypothetical protein